MKNSLTLWTLQHKNLVFICLIFMNVTLALLSILTGILVGPVKPAVTLAGFVVLTIAIALIFLTHWRNRLTQREVSIEEKRQNLRRWGFGMNVVAILLFVLLGSDMVYQYEQWERSEANAHITLVSQRWKGDARQSDKRLIRARFLKTFAPVIRKFRKKADDTGSRTFTTILATAVSIGLGYLIAALSCSLSCNGYEALAALVGIGGSLAVLIAFGLVFISIWGLRKVENRRSGAILSALFLVITAMSVIALYQGVAALVVLGIFGIIGAVVSLILMGKYLSKLESQQRNMPSET